MRGRACVVGVSRLVGWVAERRVGSVSASLRGVSEVSPCA